MRSEFAGAIDLSYIAKREEGVLTHEEISSRYLHMVVQPDTLAQAYWMDAVLSQKPEIGAGVVLAPNMYREEESPNVEELFRRFAGRVAKSSANQFGVKDMKLVAEMLGSEAGVNRFRKTVVAGCANNYPSPYNDFDAFTHRFGRQWNVWYPLFVDNLIPAATTEERNQLHIEQRIHLAKPGESGLILQM